MLNTANIKTGWNELAKMDYSFYIEYVHRRMYRHSRHTQLICQYLTKVERGEIERLMLLLPPRHGKSMTVTETFPSWFIGCEPERRVIAVSYGDRFAKKFGRLNKQKIQEYGQDIFNIRLPTWSSGTSSASDWGITRKLPDGKIEICRGGMLSVGIGGPITGEGADLLLIDDPIKNRKEADSPTYRDTVWNEYTNTLLTRLQPGGRIILIQTRWHVDDLAGRVLEQERDAWTVLELPAICDSEKDVLGRAIGEALWPEGGYDVENLKRKEKRIGQRVWFALYQQKPFIADGSKVKREWFRYYKELPTVVRKIQSWDTGLKEGKDNDPSCCHTWAQCQNGYYLLDRYNRTVDFPKLLQEMKNRWAAQNKEDEPLDKVLIEDAVSGTSAYQTLRVETSLPIFAISTRGRSKELRADSITPLIEAGKVFLPDPTYHNAPWVLDFVNTWCAFPNVVHDEDIDCTSQALEELKKSSQGLIHTSDEIMAVTPILEQTGKIVVSDQKGNAVDTVERENKPLERYESIKEVEFYTETNNMLSDHLLSICKDSGHVPYSCMKKGMLVMDSVRNGIDPCGFCSYDRDSCRGRPKIIIIEKVVQSRRLFV